VKDVFETMHEATGNQLETLLADGGACRNDWLMQFQADLLDRPVLRCRTLELSALGAAFAAGLGCGLWRSTDDIAGIVSAHDTFRPQLAVSERRRLGQRWNAAVASVKAFAPAAGSPGTPGGELLAARGVTDVASNAPPNETGK